jgi:DNA processing protein
MFSRPKKVQQKNLDFDFFESNTHPISALFDSALSEEVVHKIHLPSQGIEGFDYLENFCFLYLILLRTPFIGPVTFNACKSFLLEEERHFFSKPKLLKQLGFKEKSIEACLQLSAAIRENQLNKNTLFLGAKQDCLWAMEADNHIVFDFDESYPDYLKELYDAPPVLFVKGNVSLLKNKQLAVVGTRRPSKIGLQEAKKFSQHLVQQGLVVTSGLASGIDRAAHEGALAAASDSTVAVLAHGLDEVYPRSNRQLAEKIIEQGGTLVSEFPLGVQPKPEYFPRRNRIISGLSLGVLVVEAACKSGSLLTAYSAVNQNREVFAIPGSIHNPVAKGCHELIKDGAKLVENTGDILNELYLPQLKQQATEVTPNGAQKTSTESLSKLEGKVLAKLNHEERSINEIAELLGLKVQELSATITLLELKGFAEKGEKGFFRNPGGT